MISGNRLLDRMEKSDILIETIRPWQEEEQMPRRFVMSNYKNTIIRKAKEVYETKKII